MTPTTVTGCPDCESPGWSRCTKGGRKTVSATTRKCSGLPGYDHAAYEAGMALLGLAQSRTYEETHTQGGLRRGAVPHGPAARNPSMLALALYDQAEPLSMIEPETARDRYERAIGLARAAGSSFIEGIALVGLASLLGRSGRPSTALPQFLAIIDRWHDMGIWHHQWTTLRNLVQLLSGSAATRMRRY